MRGFNDDELVPLVEFGRDTGAEVRFIEYMDVGGATRWDRGVVVAKAEMLSRLVLAFGPLEPVATDVRQPADQFRLADGTVVGVIASVSEPFCQTCDRSRITADGTWLRCLYATSGTDLRTPLRDGASDEELERLIEAGWSTRTDRGAEDRARHRRRVPLAVNVLQHEPHLEMHTRGG